MQCTPFRDGLFPDASPRVAEEEPRWVVEEVAVEAVAPRYRPDEAHLRRRPEHRRQRLEEPMRRRPIPGHAS